MHLRSVLLLSALLALPTLLISAGADPAAKPASPTPKKLTLAQALTSLPLHADGGLLLTVSSEQVTLPDGTDAPPADASLEDVAGAFGDQTVTFGSVTAVAPQTMAVLNTQPDPPNLAADMNYSTAFKMLAASLDDTQWKALTSEQGLGLGDLTDDTQRGLFHALFNHGHLWIASDDPALQDLPDAQRTDVRDVTDEIDATRVRLGQTANIYLHDKKGKTLYFGRERLDGASRLHTYRPKIQPPSAEHGITLKAEVPNTLKPSDLDHDSSVLQAAMSMAGLKTVGDLVTRIGLKTGLELYADPHYAARTLVVQGTAATEPAADLLQALCVCITGTFRKVGPAYVLTDDLIGVGTRRKHLQEWQDAAFDASMKLSNQTGAIMLKRRASSARTIPSFSDPLAVTPEEMAAVPDMPGLPGVPREDGAYPFAKLTPPQQELARQTAAEFDEQLHGDSLPFYLKGDDLAEADLTKNVDLGVDYKLQMLVPSAGMPVDTNLQMDMWMLYYPGDTEESRKGYAEEQAKAQAKLPPAPSLSAALHLGQRRAVEAHTRTAKDVDALVAAMQKLGLNTLLLDVFSHGVNHVKASASNGTDILTEAPARTRGTGIAVYADISLLTWGDAPPELLQDLTIDGQNSREAAVAHEKASSSEKLDTDGKIIPFTAPGVRVSPASSAVYGSLAALVQDLAARPGLAGFVWEDADTDNDLGYTLPMRLAFLRSAHADPVDITTQHYLRADDSLPLFDDKDAEAKLADHWTKAQTQVDSALLGHLYAAARSGAGLPLPILMEQRQYSYLGWMASWDDPKLMPPPLRELSPGAPYPSADVIMRLARSQGRIVLRCETVANDGETPALARKLSDDLKAMPSDGFVLEFNHEEETQGAAPLDSLVQAVDAERAPAQKAAK